MKTILIGALYVLFAPIIGGLLAGFDRKISARMQGRQGPPILQPFYDLFKLFSKETVIVNTVQSFFVISFLVFTTFTGILFFVGGDIMLVIFSLTLASIFFILAAHASNSVYSSLGAQRELLQMMAYEPMVLIVAIGLYKVTGSFAIKDIISTNMLPIFYIPGIFLGYLYILTIKLRKSPFDLSTSHHAHQEMVKGVTTEFSGSVLGMVELSHWYENTFLVGIIALFFINSNWWSWILAILVCIGTYFIEIIIDNTFARAKWQFMLNWTWIVTFTLGALNLLILSFII